ncbi:MAG: class I SAM-dependent methyltransferase [Planctomycetota bacterium]|nr:MAG: class I SAM-dependent methyltransferase [Planctomycetota bacterium]
MTDAVRLDIESRQQLLFDRLADRYEAHYDDATSRWYRDWFIHPPLFSGVPLSGRRVLDAMCGSGETTRYLLRQGARVEGLDVSAECIERYRRRWPGCPGHAVSILSSGLPDASYDVVVTVGGLHHVHPHIDEAVAEIHRLLKPGGIFCFLEPHAGSLPDVLRRVWYRRDGLFEDNERAVDIEALMDAHRKRFEFLRLRHLGSLAYLLVLNSMIFRVPVWLKPLYAPLALGVEFLLDPLLTRRLSCIAIAQWRKR